MAAKTPAERAVADVEKAIKTHDTALEKAEAAQRKADELVAKANRADRELQWYSRHPDLPDNFDLDEFRRSLEAPFVDEGELDLNAPDIPEPTTVDVPDSEVNEEPEPDTPDKPEIEIEISDAGEDSDDPWAGEA